MLKNSILHPGAQILRCVGVWAILLLFLPFPVFAQESPTGDQPEEDERPTGLPAFKNLSWKFNLDAGWGSFSFFNTLDAPDPSGSGFESDNWFEGYIKAALSATYTLENGELYGRMSAVGERTYGEAPTIVGGNATSFKEEDIYIGWRSGKSIGDTENLLDFSVGRQQYTIGHGFVVWDGSSEGGSLGGYWSNARKAWAMTAIGRLQIGNHKFQGFYLEKSEPPERETGSRLGGVNYDFTAGKNTTFGATYFETFADKDIVPLRDGMNVFHARAYTAPIPRIPDLSFEVEYAYEKNGDLLESTGWSIRAAYKMSALAWTPKFSYRYAFFQGDDPDTLIIEAFDPLFLGFYDWGTWWQGEIAGGFSLSNSNSISHVFRIHFVPYDKLGWGVIYFIFRNDEPRTFRSGAISKDVASEVNVYCDWKFYTNFMLTTVIAYDDPGKAAKEAFNRNDAFWYGLAYVSYSF